MKISTPKFSWLSLFTVLLIIAACSEEETAGIQGDPLVSESELQAKDGHLLLRIDDLPGDIPVDEEIRFGAATHFTGANLSPDGIRLAITTAGTSHGAGWMLDLETEQIIPAAFQFGGSVETGPWSDNGRYAIFINKNPASGQTLTIADTRSEGSIVAETSMPIRLPEHDESGAGEKVYQPISWEEDEFIFGVDGAFYRYNPGIGEILEY